MNLHIGLSIPKKFLQLIKIFIRMNRGASGRDLCVDIENLSRKSFTLKWIIFWDTLHSFNRCAELERLIRWSKWKKLPGPRNAYKFNLQRELLKLGGRKIKYPQVYRSSRCVYHFGRIVARGPHYHSKGSASTYRSK